MKHSTDGAQSISHLHDDDLCRCYRCALEYATALAFMRQEHILGAEDMDVIELARALGAEIARRRGALVKSS